MEPGVQRWTSWYKASDNINVQNIWDIKSQPVIALIKWLRPKGLKVCSYVEKYAEFKNQTLKKSAGTQKCYAQRNTPGVCNISNSAKMGVPLHVYNLKHVVLVVKCKFWQQTVYNDQYAIYI